MGAELANSCRRRYYDTGKTVCYVWLQKYWYWQHEFYARDFRQKQNLRVTTSMNGEKSFFVHLNKWYTIFFHISMHKIHIGELHFQVSMHRAQNLHRKWRLLPVAAFSCHYQQNSLSNDESFPHPCPSTKSAYLSLL